MHPVPLLHSSSAVSEQRGWAPCITPGVCVCGVREHLWGLSVWVFSGSSQLLPHTHTHFRSVNKFELTLFNETQSVVCFFSSLSNNQQTRWPLSTPLPLLSTTTLFSCLSPSWHLAHFFSLSISYSFFTIPTFPPFLYLCLSTHNLLIFLFWLPTPSSRPSLSSNQQDGKLTITKATHYHLDLLPWSQSDQASAILIIASIIVWL